MTINNFMQNYSPYVKRQPTGIESNPRPPVHAAIVKEQNKTLSCHITKRTAFSVKGVSWNVKEAWNYGSPLFSRLEKVKEGQICK